MLKGVMKLKGNIYTLYLEEFKYRERIDICIPNTIFNIEPDKVLFSRVTGKVTKRKGDDELYSGYEELKALVHNLTQDRINTSTRINNETASIETITKGDHPSGMFYEKIRVNTKLKKISYYYDDDNLIVLEHELDQNEQNLNPIDISRYKEEVSLIQKKLIATEGTVQEFRDAKTLKKLFNIAHLDNKDIGFIESEKEAEKYLKIYKSLPKTHKIGFDFETTTLEMHSESDGRLTGLVISMNKKESRYFPFFQDNTYNLPWKYFEYLLESIKHTIKVAHNAQFEQLVLSKYGYPDYEIDRCSLITTQIATGMPLGMRYDLKSLYEDLTGERNLDLKDVFPNKTIKFNVLPKDVITLYACPDGYSTLVVDEHYYNKCDEMRKGLLEHIEWRLPSIKADARLWGIKFNKEELAKTRDLYTKDLEMLSKIFKDALHVDANLNSADQLESIIYDKLRCPAVVMTKTKKRSTGKLALNYLASLKKPKEQIPEKEIEDILSHDGSVLIEGKVLKEARYPTMVVLQQYKLMQKLVTTYFDKFIENPYDYYHFWVNQNVRTGRQSSNMHQLPKSIAKFAEADDEEFALCDADWSQVELRMMIYKSQEKNLIKLCNNPMLDIHRMIYSIVLGKEIWEVSKEERGKSKPVNFGVVYMIQAVSLAKQIYGANPSKEQIEECRKAIQLVYESFPRIYKYTQDNIAEAKSLGFVRTEYGRIRSFPGISNTQMFERSTIAEMERQANNTKTQGSCADLLKISEIKIKQWIKEEGWDEIITTKKGNKRPLVRVILSLHDELLISYHKSIPEWRILEMMYTSMLHNLKGIMPLYPAMGFGKVWAQAKSDATELSVGAIQDIIKNKVIFDGELEDRHKAIKQYSDNFDMHKLDTFMQEIINQNYPKEEIWKHVKDGVFTHTIIDLYPNKKIKNHYERIEYAVNEYLKELEQRKQGIFEHKSKEDDYTVSETLKEYAEIDVKVDAEDLVQYDDKGNIFVYDDIHKEDFDEIYKQNIDDEYDVTPRSFISLDRVYETLQEVVIIMYSEDREKAKQVEEILKTEHDPEGLKEVFILLNNKELKKTKYRVERCTENLMSIETILKGVA